MSEGIRPQIGLLVLLLSLVLVAAVPVSVSAETVKIMVGTFERLDREDILKSFARLPEGSCLVVMDGAAESIPIIDGYLTVEVPSPGQADLIIAGTEAAWEQKFAGRSFRVVFDQDGNFTAFDLDDPDSPNVPYQLGVGQGSDGSYHFEFLKDNMFVFSWAEPGGPIMGRTYNWQHDNYESSPGTSRWNPTDEGIMRVFRSWSFNEVDGLIPGMEVVFHHPNGTSTERFYPGPENLGQEVSGVDADGNNWLWALPVDGHSGVSGLVWKWRCDYKPAFTQDFMSIPGTHAVVYTLISPNGPRSNHRVEFFTVE